MEKMLLWCMIVCCLSACGQAGNLYLPQQQDKTEQDKATNATNH